MILTILVRQDVVLGAVMCSTTVYNGRQSGTILSVVTFSVIAEFVNLSCTYTHTHTHKTKQNPKGWRCTYLNCE